MTYVLNTPTYEAALWDGVDPDPLDAFMTERLGAEYLGYSVSGGVITLTVTETVAFAIFGPSGTSRAFTANTYCTFGPLYEGEHVSGYGATQLYPYPSATFELLFTEA